MIRPLDADTIRRLYHEMPEYTRISVLIARDGRRHEDRGTVRPAP